MDARRAELEAETLYEIGKVLSLSTDLNKAFTSALNLLALYLGMENGTLSLFDPVTGEVFIEAAPEMRDEERILGRFRPGEGLVGRIFANGMPVAIPDIAREPVFLNRTGSWRDLERDPRAFVGVPVQDGRAVLGVLTVDRPHRGGPLSLGRDVRLLTAVAHLMGARVRLMQLESPQRRAAQDLPPVAPELERFPGVVGHGQRMREVLRLVSRVARSRATVLLRGESGTGKELFAHALHEASPRAERPFVAVNCAALPEALVESELFGHEKGAFTGAAAARPGRFEQADGGTLFLDEVGELSPGAQAKLLRALQERQFERIGGRRTVTVDVRLVAATNRDLEEMVRAGTFRLDLYHRLSVVTLELPPLRDRPEDLAALAQHFLAALAEEHGRPASLGPGVLEVLRACRLSGNARQLRNCLERALVSSTGDALGRDDFPCARAGGVPCMLERVLEPAAPRAAAPAPLPLPPPASPAAPPAPGPAGAAPGTEAADRARVLAALERCGYVQAKAARLLGMTYRQVAYRVRKYGIAMERL
ncbi:transcriptional regulator, NifA, Fis Family [Anaeromyxobacter sp. K]|uniref:nif-specific transcriptional activator NifA n=1 Tax=Anaeromyxobacter sp. (strain K) TaxID=447217 RepID=UPI00015F9117|nr:nif-specific transcriptional activator NifA [Anaeromyxobacter sp. K]ACG74432.1 transcriptional regulator, NifA, Fis Family [Anaeromyxobacter sp. K]